MWFWSLFLLGVAIALVGLNVTGFRELLESSRTIAFTGQDYSYGAVFWFCFSLFVIGFAWLFCAVICHRRDGQIVELEQEKTYAFLPSRFSMILLALLLLDTNSLNLVPLDWFWELMELFGRKVVFWCNELAEGQMIPGSFRIRTTTFVRELRFATGGSPFLVIATLLVVIPLALSKRDPESNSKRLGFSMRGWLAALALAVGMVFLTLGSFFRESVVENLMVGFLLISIAWCLGLGRASEPVVAVVPSSRTLLFDSVVVSVLCGLSAISFALIGLSIIWVY